MKLKEREMVGRLWREREFVKLVDDEGYGFLLTRLFSYAVMDGEEVDALVGMGW